MSWTSANDNGFPVRYEYRYKKASTSSWSDLNSPWSPVVQPLIVGGLINGANYNFQMRAINELGERESSTVTKEPRSVPIAPVFNVDNLGNTIGPGLSEEGLGEVTLRWDPLGTDLENGGASVTRYDLRVNGGNWNEISTSASTDSHVVEGLINGGRYLFDLQARNTHGIGPYSQIILIPGGPPDPPSSLTLSVTYSGSQATVDIEWLAPASDYGRPVTGYKWDRINYLGDGEVDSGVFSDEHSFARTSADKVYTYSVWAINQRGEGNVISDVITVTAAPP